jgi:hypothetical protein
MSFKPTDEWRYCPRCCSAEIEVDESRDDYYLGPIFRCANGHGFYATPADPTPIPYREPPEDMKPLIATLKSALSASPERFFGRSVLLAELARGDIREATRVPIRLEPPA